MSAATNSAGSDLNMSQLAHALEDDKDSDDHIDVLADDSLARIVPHLVEDPQTKSSLHALRDLQKDHDAIFAEYIREKQQLEKKYEARFFPNFQRRQETLSNSTIQNFWFTAFENCEVLRENITEKDAVALRFLSDVTCETVTYGTENPAYPVGSFILRFFFRDNPFFENDVLVKTYIMQEDDFEDLAEAHGCRVLWKPGKDLTVRTFKKKTKNGRVLIKKQPTDSFFNFFTPPEADADMDPELMEELEDVRDADFELGECIRSDLIPRALLYFLDVIEGEEEDEDEDEEESGDDDDDDDDDGGDVSGKHENGTLDGHDADDEDSPEEDNSRRQKPAQPPPSEKSSEECKQQ